MQQNNLISIRDKKGNNFIDFPDIYTVVDIETTGFSPKYDSILEISAIKVENQKIVDKFEKLIKSESSQNNDDYIDTFIEQLTGITNGMIKENANDAKIVLKEFSEFIGTSIVVGHNVNFDINFLYDNFIKFLGYPLTNNFIDTMRIFKKIKPEIKHHRLSDLCTEYDINNSNEHRAYSDCEATYLGYVHLKDTVLLKYGNISEFINKFKKKKTKKKKSFNIKDIVGDSNKINRDSLLYMKKCVFTGTLQLAKRKCAFQVVKNIGGTVSDTITKKTDFLICSEKFYREFKEKKQAETSKIKKAKRYILQGCNIKIIPESDFYDMIGEEIYEFESDKN